MTAMQRQYVQALVVWAAVLVSLYAFQEYFAP